MNVKKEMPTGSTIDRSLERARRGRRARQQVVRRGDEEVVVLEVAEHAEVAGERERRGAPCAARGGARRAGSRTASSWFQSDARRRAGRRSASPTSVEDEARDDDERPPAVRPAASAATRAAARSGRRSRRWRSGRARGAEAYGRPFARKAGSAERIPPAAGQIPEGRRLRGGTVGRRRSCDAWITAASGGRRSCLRGGPLCDRRLGVVEGRREPRDLGDVVARAASSSVCSTGGLNHAGSAPAGADAAGA